MENAKIKLEKTLGMDLNNSNKSAYGALYEHYLENGKQDSFIVPLVVNNKNKTVLTVNTINACLYAFCIKTGKTWKVEFIQNATEDAQNTNRVKLCVINGSIEDNYELVPTSKENGKRPSSKVTKAQSDAKKSAKQEEMNAEVKKWNSEKTKQILDVVNAKCKLTTKDYNDLQGLILKILEK